MNTMKIKFLALQVKRRRITLEQVPSEYRESVREELENGV